MKKIQLSGRMAVLAVLALLWAGSPMGENRLFAQKVAGSGVKDGVSDTSASLGLGTLTRFSSGYTPIQIERTSIQPGRPFKVKATMDNFISTSKESFGGLLNLYNTANFGKFFSIGQTSASTALPTRALPPTATATVISNEAGVPKMYPPRLAIDYVAYPTSNLDNEGARKRIDEHVRRILGRLPPLDQQTESLLVVFQESKIILRGKLKSAQTAESLLLGLSLESGVEEMVNELEIIPTEEPVETDPLGYPAANHSRRAEETP